MAARNVGDETIHAKADVGVAQGIFGTIVHDMLSIYLCGPIEGCTLEEATIWRKKVDVDLGSQFKILDPMRGKYRIVPPGQIILKDTYNPKLNHLCASDAIYGRDMFAVRHCDIILANLELASRGGRGTFFEMGAAAVLGKLLGVVTPDKAMLSHPFVEMSSVKYQTMDEAIDFLRTMA
jgi:nucleoside 2-deoxyribosyltransferase